MMYRWYKQRFSTIMAPAIKIWANGLPLKADTYQSCTNFCKYCYANSLRESALSRNGVKQNLRVARILDIPATARFFDKAFSGDDARTPFMNWCLRSKYYIELGTTGETFQEADVEFKTTREFLNITSNYGIPLFINTKLNLVCTDDNYKKLLTEYKAPVIICLTLTTDDDKLGKLYEHNAPLPSERLRTVKELSKYPNIETIVYISPFMPGVTDVDTKRYAGSLVDAGIVGAHLRDFYIQGEMFSTRFWKKYKEDNKDSLTAFPGGQHVKYSVRKRFYDTFQAEVSKRDPNFKIVGMKSKWFELNPYHGKMCYDYLPESFKSGIVDWTSIPILRKVRDNKSEPQLLSWDKIGYKRDKINYPEYINTNEGGINNLMVGRCSCVTSDRSFYVDGYSWVTDGLWNGWGTDEPSGLFSKMSYVYPVKDKKGFMRDDSGNFMYAYIPSGRPDLLDDSLGRRFLFSKKTTPSDFFKPFVSWDTAKKFKVPERLGGTEDKWLA